jgi:hypothetical protein
MKIWYIIAILVLIFGVSGCSNFDEKLSSKFDEKPQIKYTEDGFRYKIVTIEGRKFLVFPGYHGWRDLSYVGPID